MTNNIKEEVEKDKILKEFDEQILYKNKDGTRWNCMSLNEERVHKQFLLSSLDKYANAKLEEAVEQLEHEKVAFGAYNIAIDRAISIIKSKIE